MSQMQPVRGTRDLLPEECEKFRFVQQTAREVSLLHGFGEIETPIIEPASLFNRSLGDGSDIVAKEMYQFQDRGGDEIVLRPEGTAGVARAFISEGLAHSIPLKFFYNGPMFRYERPQKGRYRQFYQFGVEILGVDSPLADIEAIALASMILQKLNLQGNIILQLNTLGDTESRARFRQSLIDYFSKYQADLSADSKVRLQKNPLRILDSKDPGDQKLFASAPLLENHLNESSLRFFENVKTGLEKLEIPYQITQSLVRGIDYYCHTVFEFVSDSLGAQSTVLGGGRYDGLIKDLGGPATPSVGWAFGVDRLTLILKDFQGKRRLMALIPIGTRAESQAPQLAHQLRQQGLAIDLAYGGNLNKRMKRADKIGADFAILMGDNELDLGKYQIKNLKSGDQQLVEASKLVAHLQSQLA